MPDVSRTPPSGRYRARDARASPFYLLVQDHLEEYLARGKQPRDLTPKPSPLAESAFRAFLACGILRYGAVRFRCPDCGEDLFVALSCKRRGLCPLCRIRHNGHYADSPIMPTT